MARREIIRGSTAGVQLIEVVHQMSRRVFSRYAVTTRCGRGRRDFVSLRTARAAFVEAVAACRDLEAAEGTRSPVQSWSGHRRAAGSTGAGGLDGQS